MKNFKKVLAVVLAVVAGVTVLSGCAKKSDKTGYEYIKEKGKLVVGLDDTFAPMGFRDTDGKLVGFDIDLATEVAKDMGVEIEFMPIDWKAKELALSSKRVDCLWNGMSATEERQKSMSLTKKYLNNKIVMISLKPEVKINSADDMKNYNVATQAGSSALEMIVANEKYDTFKDKIKEYDDYDQAIMDMEAGRIDAIAIDQVLGEYKNSKRTTKFVEQTFDFGDDFYAVGCRKGENDLSSKIDEAFDKLMKSGKAEEISKKWFGKNIMILEGYDAK
ncbi:MAG: amino acid ABC transporter substrate-binding protein [Clostridia bacterium]